jgi:DNA polymerase III epsilon subunit-like protein
MKVLIFDTETSGLPTTKEEPSCYNMEKFPFILQLSYIVFDTSSNYIVDIFDNLIKIDQNIISQGSYQIHKISFNDCCEKGVPIYDALKTFIELYHKCDLIVGHNVTFDLKMINIECLRNLVSPILYKSDKDKIYCTMMNSINIVKIEKINRFGQKYFKFPKLIETFKHLFDYEPNHLHNAFTDILCCFRVFHFIYFGDDIYHKESNFKKLFIQNQ